MDECTLIALAVDESHSLDAIFRQVKPAFHLIVRIETLTLIGQLAHLHTGTTVMVRTGHEQ